MKLFIKNFILAIVCVLTLTVVGQDDTAIREKKDLQSKRATADKKIKELSSLIKDTKNNQRHNELSVILLDKKMTAREQLIRLYSQEVGIIDQEIKLLKEEKQGKEADLKILKEEYADMLYYAYKNKSSYDKLSFIFSSDDFSEAYKRLKYIQELAAFRQEQAKLIKKAQLDIDSQVYILERKLEEKQLIIIDKQKERDELSKERNEKEIATKELKKEVDKYKAELRRKQKERDDLNRAIMDIIKRIAESKKTSSGDAIPLSPAEKELAASFSANKGKLPWPSGSGQVVVHFGKKQDKVHHVKTINNGIDIAVRKGETARVVFDGVVEGVILLPGNKYSVLVRHGSYFSLYSNLEKPYVSSGDKVSTKDPLGLVKTDSDKGTILHFQVWNSTEPIDPETWILRR